MAVVTTVGGYCGGENSCGISPATGKYLECFNGVCTEQAAAIDYVVKATERTALMNSGAITPTEFARLDDLFIQASQQGINFLSPDTTKVMNWYNYAVSQFPTVGLTGPLDPSNVLYYLGQAVSPLQSQASALLSLAGYLPQVDPKTGAVTNWVSSGATPISISAVPGELISAEAIAYLNSIGAGGALKFTAPTRPLDAGQALLVGSVAGLLTTAPLAGGGLQTPAQKAATGAGVGFDKNTLLIVAGVGLAAVGAALFFLSKPSRV